MTNHLWYFIKVNLCNFYQTIKIQRAILRCDIFWVIYVHFIIIILLSFNSDLIWVDFERSGHKTIKIVLLESIIFSCKFNLGQS